ncbi:MAG: hypothetical protein ACP5H2_02780 [Solirubrobacteraceae bacterium]
MAHAPVSPSDRSAAPSEHAAVLTLDIDRWADEGGGMAAESPTPLLVPAVAQR